MNPTEKVAYVRELYDRAYGHLAVCLMIYYLRTDPDVLRSSDYVRLACGPFGDFGCAVKTSDHLLGGPDDATP